MFHSKLFRRLFFTYVTVIFTCFIVYTSFLIYENYQINKIDVERRSEMQMEEVSSIMEKRLMNAQNIVQNLSYSTSMKQLYLSSILDTTLDSYALFSIQSEMKNTMTMGGLSIYKTVIFVNGSTKAYSSGGVIILADEYAPKSDDFPYMTVSTVNEAFGLDNKRYSFNQEFLLYCDAYTYQAGSEVGTICIMIDLKNLLNELKSIVQDGYGVRILYQGEEIVRAGEPEGKLFVRESEELADITYEVYASSDVRHEGNGIFFLIIVVSVVISLFFVWLAFMESKKYYAPIDHMEQMVAATSGESDDQMENIINGIQNLIGEKNGYREKMLTIAPYARTGMLHSMITSKVETEAVHVFSEENYLDLKKPYFIVSVINMAYDGRPALTEEDHKQKIKELFELVTNTYSTEEVQVVSYFRDIYNTFLIVNFDDKQEMDELFYQMHKSVSNAMEKYHCFVTMGVDIVRDDIGELRTACKEALKALDGIMADGRGEVYFSEDSINISCEHYFPINYREKLKRCIQKRDKNEIHILLFDIYKKNMDMSGTPEMYRALVDEFHLETTKALKEITERNTLHLNIEKYAELGTLQEIFDYYDAALLSIIDARQEQTEEDFKLENDIKSYIEANYCDPNLSMQALMEQFNVSSKYLSIFCKDHYGMTYLQYIQTRRIKKAAELLQNDSLTLAEIGELCGYTNQLTFRRNFKSIMGVNPSDYGNREDEN